MNIRTAISFPIKDPNWIRKLFVGSIVFMFSMPILTVGIPLMLGWTIQIGRKVWHGLESPLPSWRKAGEFFVEGLKLWIANLVWFIPTILVVAVLAVKITYDLVSQCSGGGNECAFITVLTTWFPIMVTASMLIISLWPLQLGVAIQTGSLVQMLNPMAAFRLLCKNSKGFFLAWISGVLSMSFLALIGMIAFVLPWFVFNFDFQNGIVFGLAVVFIMVFVFLLVSFDIFGMVVSSHLFGQALASVPSTGHSIPACGEEGRMSGCIGA